MRWLMCGFAMCMVQVFATNLLSWLVEPVYAPRLGLPDTVRIHTLPVRVQLAIVQLITDDWFRQAGSPANVTRSCADVLHHLSRLSQQPLSTLVAAYAGHAWMGKAYNNVRAQYLEPTAAAHSGEMEHGAAGFVPNKRRKVMKGSEAAEDTCSTVGNDRSAATAAAAAQPMAAGPHRKHTAGAHADSAMSADTLARDGSQTGAGGKAESAAEAAVCDPDGVNPDPLQELCSSLAQLEGLQDPSEVSTPDKCERLSVLFATVLASPIGAGADALLRATVAQLTDHVLLLLVQRLVVPSAASSLCKALLQLLLLPRLQQLSAGVSQTLSKALAAALAAHARSLIAGVLEPLLACPSAVTSHQAHAITRLLKERSPAAEGGTFLHREVLRSALASSVENWQCDSGPSEGFLSVMTALVEGGLHLNEALASKLVGFLQDASTSPAMRKSIPFMKLLLGLVTQHGAVLSGHQALALKSIATSSSTFLKKAVLAKLEKIVPS